MATKDSVNPVVPFQPRSGTALLNQQFILNNRRALRLLRRVVETLSLVRDYFSIYGGLESALLQAPETEESQEVAERYGSLQNALFIDRFTNGSIDTVPTVQTMFEMLRENNNIIKAIAQELEDCCEEIKDKLDNLNNGVPNKFRNLLRRLREGLQSILDRIQALDDKLFNFYETEKSRLINLWS
jgi:FtsZ-binding cell division protein ZapB